MWVCSSKYDSDCAAQGEQRMVKAKVPIRVGFGNILANGDLCMLVAREAGGLDEGSAARGAEAFHHVVGVGIFLRRGVEGRGKRALPSAMRTTRNDQSALVST